MGVDDMHKNEYFPLPGVEPGMAEYSIATCYSGWCSMKDKMNYLKILTQSNGVCYWAY